MVAGPESFLRKNPAIEVWFLELEVDFFSEGGGAGVPLVILEEPTMFLWQISCIYQAISSGISQ